MHLVIKGIFWFGAYCFLALLPLATALLADSGRVSRPFLLDLAVAAGFVGLALMALESVLIARIRAAAEPFGEDMLQQFHRQMGIFASLLVLAHPALLFIAGYPPACWLNPIAECANLATQTAALSLYSLLLLIVTSIWRKQLRMNYETWFTIHSLAALVALGAALFHIFILGRHTAAPLLKILWVLYAALVIGVMLHYRVWVPLRNWNRSWQVVENRPEQGEARTLTLRPVGHEGFNFEPGQFAWIKVGPTPFGFGQHPISMSSAADVAPGGEVGFTIKALGDWSGETVPALQSGNRVWLDGPYGVFSSDRHQAMGYALIAGGVGVAPLHAICQTMADREDPRPVVLFFGADRQEDLMLFDKFEDLQSRMQLTVVPVLAEPPPGWEGETGYITGELIQRYLPPQGKWFNFMICGPGPLMDAMDRELPAIGVAPENILAERFDMV